MRLGCSNVLISSRLTALFPTADKAFTCTHVRNVYFRIHQHICWVQVRGSHFLRTPYPLQLVTSAGFSEPSAEILFKSTWSKHMINARFPSQLGLIIQRFKKPLIPLKIHPAKAAFYDTWCSYLGTPFSSAWKECYEAQWFIKNTASYI